MPWSVGSETPGQLPLKQGGQFRVKRGGQLGVKYSVEGTWNKIQGFQKIRNSIIHDNSVLYDKLSKMEKEEKYLYKLISKRKDTLKIDTDSKSFKITDSKLLKEFTKLMYTYFKFIVGQTKEKKLPKK